MRTPITTVYKKRPELTTTYKKPRQREEVPISFDRIDITFDSIDYTFDMTFEDQGEIQTTYKTTRKITSILDELWDAILDESWEILLSEWGRSDNIINTIYK